MSWAAAFKLAPYLVIALLLGAVLWLRGDLINERSDREAAETRVTDLTEANKSLEASLAVERQKQKDNDAIAADVAAAVESTRVREVHTRETITEVVRDDPEAAAWADTPVPDGVRAGLRTGQVDTPPR